MVLNTRNLGILYEKLATTALLGLRLTREKNPATSSEPAADDFEIIDETDTDEPH